MIMTCRIGTSGCHAEDAAGRFKDAAGQTSLDGHKQEDEDYAINDNRIKGDGPQTGGEAGTWRWESGQWIPCERVVP